MGSLDRGLLTNIETEMALRKLNNGETFESGETSEPMPARLFYEGKESDQIITDAGTLPRRWKWLDRYHAWRLDRKWRGASPSLVMTTYRDQVIIADNDTRRIYAVTNDPALGWKIETIGTF